MAVIDSNNFITHLVWSGLINKATCGELKEAIELCTVKDIYTKADMVAMLTEIQLEIEEKEQHYQDKFLEPKNAVHDAAMGGRMFGCGECKEVIQQKINALKAEKGKKDDK